MQRCVKQLILLLICVLPLFAVAQNQRKEKLQREKIKLQDEIELANKILSETRSTQQNTMSTIQTVEQKLKLRQNLISTLDRETELLNKDITKLQNTIDTLEEDVAQLKDEYAKMIRQAERSKNSYSRLMFILSSRDFNQAIRRIEYLKQISEYRRKQVEEIKEKESDLNAKLDELNRQKVRKEALKSQMEQEQGKLQSEKAEQQKSIASLQQREKEITQQLKEKQAKAQELDNEIQRIIAAEIRRAKERAIRQNMEDEAKRVGLIAGKDFTGHTSNKQLQLLIDKKKEELRAAHKAVAEASPKTEYNLTPEATRLAAGFAANKSLLPWPVKRGLVISNFGIQHHPIAKSVIIDNKGIDIATEKGSTARAAFEGEVASIIRVPGEGYAIILSHGNYFTLYKNLSEIFVKSGDKVKSKQDLGLILTDPAEGKTVLHFEVWKETQVLDPLPWLASK